MNILFGIRKNEPPIFQAAILALWTRERQLRTPKVLTDVTDLTRSFFGKRPRRPMNQGLRTRNASPDPTEFDKELVTKKNGLNGPYAHTKKLL